jgi:hypothetical protein
LTPRSNWNRHAKQLGGVLSEQPRIMLQISALVENIDLANKSPGARGTEVTLGFSCQISPPHDKTKT